MRAAERLFAEQGIEGPTLREVGAAAGQKNHSAVQYHFGDRQGLLAAVLEPHLDDLDRRRGAMLASLAAGGPPTVDELVDVLILPLASKLEDPSGIRYLQIQASLLGADRSRWPPAVTDAWRRPIILDVMAQLARAVAPSSPEETEARQLLVLTIAFNGLANRASMAVGPPVDVLVHTISQTVRAILTLSGLTAPGTRPGTRSETPPGRASQRRRPDRDKTDV